MMNICNIIQDLLPLYADGCCTDDTRTWIREHLDQCAGCRAALDAMTGTYPVPEAEASDLEQNMKRGLQKLRRRLVTSLIVIILAAFTGTLAWNQIRGSGIHLTSLNEYRICTAFLKDLKAGDLESAYEYIDLEAIRQEWAVWNFDEDKLDQLGERGLAQFLESGAAFWEDGLDDFRYLDSYEIYEGEGYCIFNFTVTIDGETDTMRITVSDGGIQRILGGNGYLPAPDPLTQLCMWREMLWQEYAGCYWDPETKSYIYYDANA